MEKWKEVYTDEQIKTIQNIEMKILNELNRICEKLNISYFVYGGTLIGAVKFKGFVPWDDDVDVAMSRTDYEKLVNCGADVLHDEFYLQTPYSDKDTPFSYTKLRLKDTKYVEYGFHKLKIEHGIYIDIYPIDNLPDTKEERLAQFNEFQRLARLYSRRQCPYLSKTDGGVSLTFKRIIKFITSVILHIIPRKYIIRKMDTVATKYNDKKTNYYGNLYHSTPVNIFKKILPYEQGIFENLQVNLPNDWDGFLSLRYGDYKKLPPEEDRIGHKPYIIDFGMYE